MMIVPLEIASSIGKRFLPATCVSNDVNVPVSLALQNATNAFSLRDRRKTHPSIFLSHFPAVTTFSDTDDDIETVITSIETLSVSCKYGKSASAPGKLSPNISPLNRRLLPAQLKNAEASEACN
jgi:hypothetical protein